MEGIEAGLNLFNAMGKRRGWSTYNTENGAIFNASDLDRFQVIIFHNTSGDTLSKEQQQAFQTWLAAGGGWLGIHAAGDNSHTDWPWYMKNLIGVLFTGHTMGPQLQFANVNNEDPIHPVMQGLPETWSHKEEWYSWEESARAKGFHILASIDEGSYSPFQNMMGKKNDLSMGDHPIMWSTCIDSGRAVYSAMGHDTEAYEGLEHKALLESAISWLIESRNCE